jgi:hypothetical protein
MRDGKTPRRQDDQTPGPPSPVLRRRVLRAMLGAIGLGMASPMLTDARGHHKKRRKRCDKRCKNNHRTCDRGCDILDDDSQHFCKQGCKVALSQCKSNC